MAGQTYRVQRSFLHFNEGQVVTAKECQPADVEFLVGNGALKPLTAGGIPLLSAKSQAYPEDADLQEMSEEMNRLREQAEGWRQRALVAEDLAADRLESLVNLSKNFETEHGPKVKGMETERDNFANEFNRVQSELEQLQQEINAERKRANDAEAELAEVRQELDKAKADTADDKGGKGKRGR
jgi:chromosome segregation ATPase